MNFAEYQKLSTRSAIYPHHMRNLVYPAMGLVGEAGEVCEKVKKIWRKTGELSPALSEAETKAIVLEMGDVLWYLAALSDELRLSLDDIAGENIRKLAGRMANKTIIGQGDNR